MKKLVSSDFIEQQGHQWASIDNFETKLRKGRPIIVNTDHGDSPGIHWILLTLIDDDLIHVYDPLGPKNIRVSSDASPSDNHMRHFKLSFYPYATQMKTSDDCGYFCIYIADRIKALRKPLKVANINKEIHSAFGKTPDNSDVNLLENYFSAV